MQALGWATLNSFWQMAVLWIAFILANRIFSLSVHKRYIFSVFAIVVGFLWFLFSFFSFYLNGTENQFFSFKQPITTSYLTIILTSASLAYLTLLAFPSYRLFRNWHYIQTIRTFGLQKAPLESRLFIQKIASRLGIKKKVFIYLSDIVTSPVTLGYIKPIILIPVASVNNLTIQQLEAVLLHELAHIKRYDFFINFLLNIIHTLLYFNPFVKAFLSIIEIERENCCDALVLQFGYDKISYASALLTLEKTAARPGLLAIGATGKRQLLNRIENILGMKKKNGLSLKHYTGLFAAFCLIILFNSILLLQEEKKSDYSFNYTNFSNPFAFFDGSTEERIVGKAKPKAIEQMNYTAENSSKSDYYKNNLSNIRKEQPGNISQEISVPEDPAIFLPVAFDEVDGSLTKDQKEKVKTTVAATKKVLGTLQWQEVEKQIADAMTSDEKASVKKGYLQELESANWQNLEKSLKAEYQNLNWYKIDSSLSNALTLIKLDSLQNNYKLVLSQLDRTICEAEAKSKISCLPIPDASLTDIKKAKEDVHKQMEIIKAVRNKKVVRL
ncbi:MAG: M56 family metallopeptidase [Flavisolibacter sp.]|nr:M56 family metallopeptidase [Flavisolibacter sp.]